jgi:hypothetical protein
LLGQGYTVLVADLPGIGSMGPGYLKGDAYLDNTSFNQWFAGILTGQSIVAMRAQDIIRMVRFLKSEVDGIETVSAISKGALGSELLHAGLFEPGIKRIGLINMFVSYADIALTPDYKPSFITSVVAGAIKAYDLPDLMASVAPGSLLVVNPLNAMGAVCNDEEISSLLNSRDQVFGDSNSPVNFQMARDLNENQTLDTVLEWLGR